MEKELLMGSVFFLILISRGK